MNENSPQAYHVHDNQPWQEVAEECRRGISHARTLESFDSLLAYIKQLEGERDASVPLIHREQVARREAEARLEAAERAKKNVELTLSAQIVASQDQLARAEAAEAENERLLEALERTCALEESYTGEASPSRAALAARTEERAAATDTPFEKPRMQQIGKNE